MSYQVIARKWRPQKFDDVVGQQAVTRTLRNALASGRLAQAFVFAGPRGVGKTTTARILARAFNCEKGPTADPCGDCDACIEIAEGRDMDVLEIDAATHTGIDNVREVIISGLGIMPARDRYKIFIIDEVHQLSTALVQRAAQVDRGAAAARHLHDGDDRARQDSGDRPLARRRSTSSARSARRRSPTQLREIVDAEGITVGEESLQLIARDADGSMRDAQSKLDQVIAFTGKTITPRRRGDGARAGRARPAARHAAGGGRRRRAGGVRARRARRRDGLRPARRLPRAVAGRARPAGAVGRSVAHRATPRSPAKGSASG